MKRTRAPIDVGRVDDRRGACVRLPTPGEPPNKLGKVDGPAPAPARLGAHEDLALVRTPELALDGIRRAAHSVLRLEGDWHDHRCEPSLTGGDARLGAGRLAEGQRPRELGTAPAREPAQECSEYEARLGRKRHVGGDAYDDAERQAQHCSERDGASGLHVRECTGAVRVGTTALDNDAVALCCFYRLLPSVSAGGLGTLPPNDVRAFRALDARRSLRSAEAGVSRSPPRHAPSSSAAGVSWAPLETPAVTPREVVA
jgi:hypothetical protein